MKAKNEKEVEYLFSRNHEKLGFEKIVKFNPNSTPDCVALKNGKEVGIEFEYKLKNFFIHYQAKKYSTRKLYDYRKHRDKIIVFRKDRPDKIEREFPEKSYEILDPLSNLFGNIKKDPLIVKFKTLADSIQYVVCWEKDCEVNDNITVIELKNLGLK